MSPHRLAIILCAASSICAMACQRDSSTTSSPPLPVTWSSERAPYRLTLPLSWQPFSPEVLDNGADFAASHQDRILMVLATAVPSPPGKRDEPGAPQIARYAAQSIAQLEEDVRDLEVLEKKETSLGPHKAVVITAHGEVNARTSRYMIAYTGAPGWRFQIVAWSHTSQAAELSDEFDQVLSTWQITSNEPVPTMRDAGHLSKSD